MSESIKESLKVEITSDYGVDTDELNEIEEKLKVFLENETGIVFEGIKFSKWY